jgi:hypothetical protein
MSLNIQDPAQFRENIRKKIMDTIQDQNILHTIADKHNIQPETVAVNMEKGVFN